MEPAERAEAIKQLPNELEIVFFLVFFTNSVWVLNFKRHFLEKEISSQNSAGVVFECTWLIYLLFQNTYFVSNIIELH